MIALPRRPEDPIPGLKNASIGDFWAWAYSNLLEPFNRNRLAEFFVAHALGVTFTRRLERDIGDMRYQGLGVEVKAEAYLRGDDGELNTSINFDIRSRLADVFVFALYSPLEIGPDPLDVSGWLFYITTREIIEGAFNSQKSVALSRLSELVSPVSYAEIRLRIDSLLPG